MRSNDSLKVIVVGIPKTLDDSSLSELFAHYGSVADAKVVLDVNTNASRGFGFVTFTAQAAMRRAIKEMDKKQLEGRTLNVRQLVPKDTFTKDAGKSVGVSDLAKRPCYLLRKGKCNKGDRCPFSHEIKSGEFGSCFEFVQNGFCKRGDQCKFFHPAVAEEDEDGEENGDNEHEADKPYAKKAEVKKATEPVVAAAVKNTKADITNQKEKPDPKKELKKPKDDKPRYCFAYQTGRCHRGKRCLFLHEKLEVPEHEAPPPPAAGPKKRPSDFEVVTEEEPSKKRQRESEEEEEETESEEEEEEEKKPVTPVKAVKAKKEVVEKKPLKTKPKAEPQVEEVVEPEVYEDKAGKVHTGPKPICRHFLKGSCKRGRICFFLHERPAKGDEAETTHDVVMAEETEATTEENNGAPPQQAVASFFANFNSDAGVFVPFAAPAANVAAVKTAAKSPVKAQTKPDAKVAAVAAENSPAKVLKRKMEGGVEQVEPMAIEDAAVDGGNCKDVEGGADCDELEKDEEAVAAPVAAPRAKKQRYSSEWVDMGAAFDGADSDDQKRKAGGRRQPRQKVTKEQMKANREKLREERRAKRAFKTQARERLLRAAGEIELDA